MPKAEYQELDNEVIGQLLRTFNDPALKTAKGDVFGRIYEYFLTQFADLKAHDNGEFFTPISLVQMIVNVIEPDHGKVLDPACGSGGMFVQSAHFIEQLHLNPTERVTFYGMEKNPTTIRLAKMNLAVHGLEGNIQKAITYYEDPHELFKKADFVMANPPFKVDEVDADKIKNDPRLPFGLPGVNKKNKVSNGNYLWISYFYSYLNDRGRSGFVMSSQASSAGRDEAIVRRKLIEAGHVDVMIAIRANFFYTRTVPCELWFLDKGKPKEMRDKVLMIDARNVYRKVTRKIYDFSPEQLKNITSIMWLSRGQSKRFPELIGEYIQTCHNEADKTKQPLSEFQEALSALMKMIELFMKRQSKEGSHAETYRELKDTHATFIIDSAEYRKAFEKVKSQWNKSGRDNTALHRAAESLQSVAEQSRDFVKQVDQIYKLAVRLIDICEKELNARESDEWQGKEINKALKSFDEIRKATVEQLRKTRYFHKQAHWLQERFPDAKLKDVKGLVKLVSMNEIEKNDGSLSPGRYVGVVPEEIDEDFDFEETLRNIHMELQDLNQESAELVARIAKNFEELGI